MVRRLLLIWVLSAAKENRFWQLLTVLGIVLFVLAGLVALFVKGTPEEDGCYPDNDPAVAEMLKNEEVPCKYLSWRKYRNNTYSISVACIRRYHLFLYISICEECKWGIYVWF